MSDSVRPQRQQPTRLPPPRNSAGKNTGVDCHFLLQCIKVKSEREVVQSCATPSDPMDCSLPGSSVHGILQARVLEWGAIAFSVSDFRHCFYVTVTVFAFLLVLHPLALVDIVFYREMKLLYFFSVSVYSCHLDLDTV